MPKGKAPCPVDLLVPAGVKVVAVTGPNTGSCPGLSHKHSDTHTSAANMQAGYQSAMVSKSFFTAAGSTASADPVLCVCRP